MESSLSAAQAIKYAESFRQLYADERAARRASEEALVELDSSYRITVRALAAALELRDDDTGQHAERVTDLGLLLSASVAPKLLDDPQLEFAFLLHDVGKIGVSDSILLKPGALTERERLDLQRHALLGESLLRQIPYLSGTAAAVAAAHHERWDGTGYPRRLAHEEIPLAARVFSIVDAYDAMTNDRPYRAALSLDAALAEIAAQAGSQFEPGLAAEFVLLIREQRAA